MERLSKIKDYLTHGHTIFNLTSLILIFVIFASGIAYYIIPADLQSVLEKLMGFNAAIILSNIASRLEFGEINWNDEDAIGTDIRKIGHFVIMIVAALIIGNVL